MRLLVVILALLSPVSFTSAARPEGNLNKEVERLVLAPKHRAEILTILKENESLHAAFFTFNTVDIEKSVKKIAVGIDKIKHKKMSLLLKPAKKSLLAILNKSERESKNLKYHTFSEALATIVNTYDVGEDYNIYSCPMVKKTWIQNSKKKLRTHNPYAPEMPHCGGRDSDY